jgi:hypothetical protein
MNKPIKITKSDFKKSLRKELFWDVDFNKLDVNHAERLITERICSLGFPEELRNTILYFGYDSFTKTIMNVNFLDNKTLRFFSLLLNKPATKFKCYKRKLSKETHWI